MSRWLPGDERAYAYALGLYPGDGHIVVPKRGSPWLRLTLDARYDAIVAEAADALRSAFLASERTQYAYPRYFFSNLSPDIRDLFRQHCQMVGVRKFGGSSGRNVSVSRRGDVAILDAFVGPKC